MTAITEYPEWQREYWRLLRREKYTYERDAKHKLCYYEDLEPIASEADEAERLIDRMAVEKAVSELSDDERGLLYAVYYEGRSVAAIARQTGTAYRTVGYRLDRTLRKARRTLERAQRVAATASQSRLIEAKKYAETAGSDGRGEALRELY